MQFMWVALGGGVGSLIRYIVGLALVGTRFPWATLFVNLIGAFAVGVLFTFGLGRLPTSVVTPLAVGLLGGLTTFSSFAWESLTMVGTGSSAALYIVVTIVGGLSAAWLGRVVGVVLS